MLASVMVTAGVIVLAMGRRVETVMVVAVMAVGMAMLRQVDMRTLSVTGRFSNVRMAVCVRLRPDSSQNQQAH